MIFPKLARGRRATKGAEMVAERSWQKEAAPSLEIAGEESVQGPQEAKASSASDRMRRIVLENLGIVEEKARGILLPMRVSWWRTALSTLWLQNYQTMQIIKETGFVRLEIRLNPKGRFSKDLSERSRFNRSRKNIVHSRFHCASCL
jgi:hypothetical protein